MRRRTLPVLLIVCATLVTAWPVDARAQYPYPYPYPYRYGRFDPGAALRILVKPSKAEVYVDGYYAGIVDDFDGFFQRLRVPPGEHEITLYLQGYRTVHRKIYLTPDSTYKLRETMEPLAAGEPTDPRPVPQPAPPPAPGTPYPPQDAPYPPARRTPPPPSPPPQRMPPDAPAAAPRDSSREGTLVIRVQPRDAEVLIDGERWRGPESDERLVVQVAEGPHHVEVQKSGYQRYSADVQVRRGETTPLNVSLPPSRD